MRRRFPEREEAMLQSVAGMLPLMSSRNYCGKPVVFRLIVAIFVLTGALCVSTPALAQEETHIVQRGENLVLIARKYGVDVNALMAMNGIADPNVIFIGQRLLIPGDPGAGAYGAPAATQSLPGVGGYYTVRRGDTLSQIAERYAMRMNDLMRLNAITDPSTIYVGQRLRVTARAAVPVESEPAPQLADVIYVVKPGDTLYSIAKRFETTPAALMAANGLPNPNFVWSGQRLRIRSSAPVAQSAMFAAGAPADGKRWIEISLADQTLTAWQGDVAVLHTNISSGTQATPTVKGRYTIDRKYSKQRMTGPDYDLPNVPWVMYFYQGYAIHGAYWHTQFGTPRSHGCVNMRVEEAEMLYHWADFGTEVVVH